MLPSGRMNRLAAVAGATLALAIGPAAQEPTPKTNLGSDANGNPLRLAVKTGHVSNYDESKVGPYTLPDPLVRTNGSRVRNRREWPQRQFEMPVDSHMLIALSAPRPVFVTGGTRDQWADPKGQFLAAAAAGPVYRLLGREGLGVTDLPPLDTPLVDGDIGWHYHSGGHSATPEDWQAFLRFLEKYFPVAKT